MKPILFITLLLVFLTAVYYYYQSKSKTMENVGKHIKITSSVVSSGQMMPTIYTCGGKNINPPLNISNIPSIAKSLVLTLDDPDAPSGDFNHWLVWNIEPKDTIIPENGKPNGSVEGVNSAGRAGYSGPCPPSGQHRYIFTVYALDTLPIIPPNSNKKEVFSLIQDHILDSGQLLTVYSR